MIVYERAGGFTVDLQRLARSAVWVARIQKTRDIREAQRLPTRGAVIVTMGSAL